MAIPPSPLLVIRKCGHERIVANNVHTVSPFRLGVKLPPTDTTGPEWEELLTPFRDPLQYLADTGVNYVEYAVGSLENQEEADTVLRAASACARLGMSVAIHPYLGSEHNPAHYSDNSPCHDAMRRTLQLAAHASNLTGIQTVVVFHPAAYPFEEAEVDPRELRQRLLERSQAFAAELERLAKETGTGVMPVLEHQVPPNPEERLIRVADTYEGLLHVVRGTNIPLCWDTGHYLLSVRRHGQSLQPPQEFVDRVMHVHLHAVIEGCDHHPVVTDSEVLAGYLRSLWRRGFRNGITLEYSIQGLKKAGGLRKAVEKSLGLLRNWSEDWQSEEPH